MLTATTGHLRNQHLSNDTEASERNRSATSARVLIGKRRSKANTRSLEELTNLKIKVQATERELASVLSRPSFRETFAEFSDKEKNSSSDVNLEKEQGQLGAQLGSLRNLLEQLKHHISKTGEERTYLPALKLLMETLETDIVSFKQRQRERQMVLQTEERQISSELQGWESRFESWEKLKTEKYENVKKEKNGDHRKQFGGLKAAKGDALSPADGLLPDVVRFQDYIAAHGGRYGSWDDLSHTGFVRIYQKHKDASSEKLTGILQNSFPGADVEEHLRWYETFCRLEMEQKKAIRRWKQARIQRSLLNAEEASPSHASIAENDLQKTDLGHKIDPRTREGKEEEREREMKRKELSSWKERRKLQELEQKEREDRVKQVQEEHQRKVKQERQEYLKSRLSEHVKRKEQEEEDECRRREKEIQLSKKLVSQPDPKDEARKAKERDMKIALRRREEILAKQKSVTERQRRMELFNERNASNHRAARDPSRLLKPTVGILLRRKAMAEENLGEGEKGRDMAFETTVLPRRHLPSWRKGM